MKLKRLLEALAKLPPDADVYLHEPPKGYKPFIDERDPMPTYEPPEKNLNQQGEVIYPAGRVKL